MKLSPAFVRRLHWLNLPGTLLVALLQRTPAVRIAATAGDYVLAAPATAVLKSAVATLGALGALHSMAGATAYSSSIPEPAALAAGTNATIVFSITGSPAQPGSWTVGGSVPPGMVFRALGGGGAGVTSGIINTSIIQLSGTPTTAGSFQLSIIGWRGGNGTLDRFTFSYLVNVAGSVSAAPVIITQPVSRTVAAGQPASFTTAATGSPAPTFQWFRNAVAIPGATADVFTLAATAPADAGTYTLVATNLAGNATSNAVTLTITGGVATLPVVITQPVSLARAVGASAAFTVAATGSPAIQWRKNGVNIPGATAATLAFAAVAATDTASYDAVLTNSAGTEFSATAALIVSGPLTSRLSNVSVRTTLAANQLLIVGLTMQGGGKSALIRAVGPSLGALGVPGTMADPRLGVFRDATQLVANDNWAGDAAVLAALPVTGAFPFTGPASLDAAVVVTVDGGRTVQVSGPAAGNLIVEAYDAGQGITPRLTNLSARNRVGTGADILIAGFTVLGTGPKNLLIRAAGPSLGALGVPGALVDPKLELFTATNPAVKIGENDTYAAALNPIFASVGAFGFVPGAKDAAIIVSLPPGGYTVQVSGADGGTGEAIVEVYELP